MSEQQIGINKMEEEEEEGEENNNYNHTNMNTEVTECAAASRKERRKAAKKEKRKIKRKEMAELARREEEARLNDPEELLRLQAEEEQEKLRAEKERREFEERERKILEEWEKRRAQELREEEERRRRAQEEEQQSEQNGVGCENEADEDGWEYVEEGPPEIIWKGNEIIVKKKKIRVKKRDAMQQIKEEDPNRPTSNPLPPQSEAFADYKNASTLSAQQLLENVAQETPNFGTEQDKAHCPFHLKTGACRFGSRCSRIHFYPDKSCTLLIKNMYNGPGLAWEHDEGLEYTDEEVERAYEEFYEDVHTEFLKFGEIVNFKVCRNGSSHLRGNVYVHYKSLDSAVLAYQSANGRYFAGKQVQCEFVGVTRWKVAICGEFMKSKLQTCSRGTACNFIHCFRNPGGDYEWADWDKPPPRYWLKKMAALFGYSDESRYEKQVERGSPRSFRHSSRTSIHDAYRYHSRRSQSREIHYSGSTRNYSEDDTRISAHRLHDVADKKQSEGFDDTQCGDTSISREKHHSKYASSDSDSDRNYRDRGRESSYDSSRKRSRARRDRKLEPQGEKSSGNIYETDPDENMRDGDRDKYNHRGHARTNTRHQEKRHETVDGSCHAGSRWYLSDEEGVKTMNQSGKSTSARQQYKVSTSPGDHWDVRGSSCNGYWSDEDRDAAQICTYQSPGSDSNEEFGDKRSNRQTAHDLKHSRTRNHSGRGDGEDGQDCESPRNCGRNYRYSDSNSKYYPREDTGELEHGESHVKKSKRKRDADKKFDSESRIQYHEAKRSRAADYLIDEVTMERGRWEPGIGEDKQGRNSGSFRGKVLCLEAKRI
ncbi:Zinc finger CCCH domain-containing protein 5 [Sesamum angolense]|uniref:Zinc finger CCCH domain-containing protein 5 n=1 Tax=Sesamum angolense TaxID=2727404 RepID=A0AAE1WYH3_9LAMI|nr:Zinc finger CCCH domain-containing protein 5 [Sesamum angolense]